MDEDDFNNNNIIANPNSKIQQSKACCLSSINVYHFFTYIYMQSMDFIIL